MNSTVSPTLLNSDLMGQKKVSSMSITSGTVLPKDGGSALPSPSTKGQDKFFLTETNLASRNEIKANHSNVVVNNLQVVPQTSTYQAGQLSTIRERQTMSYGQLPMQYSELSYYPKRKSAYDYKEQIDEMKQNLLTPWQKVVKKLQYPLIDYNYYNNLPVKPGVFIYKALVESKYPLKQLKMNIPETLCVFNGLYWITTNQSGKLEVKSNDFLPRNFYDKVREISETAYKGQYLEPLHPAVLDRKWQQFPVSGSKSVQSWEKFNETVNYGPDSESIIQQFLYSSAQKANAVRLFYFNPKAHPGQSQTYAYYMTNTIHYAESSTKFRYEEKYTICSSRENSFEHFVMKGKVLEPYEYFADQLVSFLFKSYGLRIDEIAIDFIKDERDVIYFTDVNGFKVLEFEKVSRLALLSDEQVAERVKEEKGILDRANNTVQCSLCRISYKKSEVTKIVTYKMLFELKNHLFKRGIFGFDYLEKVSESTQSCKVCDICYMLVVAEHELIEVEKLYAISQNIPLEEKSRKTAEINRVDTENIKGKLTQWRLLFYFQEFQDIQLQALKQKCKSGKLYLQIKLFDFYTVLEIDNIISHSIIEQIGGSHSSNNLGGGTGTHFKKESQDMSPSFKKTPLHRFSTIHDQVGLSPKRLGKKMTVDVISQNAASGALAKFHQYPKTPQVILKKLRMHFLFVDKLENLENFLKNTEVEFRITDGPKWNKPLAFASAFPFTHFDVKPSEKKGQTYVQRQNILLHFFGSDLEPFYLLATTGLKKDKEIKTEEKMFLYQYNEVFFPENTYYNCEPLPIEWLELFEGREYFLERFRKEEDEGENKNLGFTPFCSIKELNYLEPDFKGRWNVRQEAIITGFSDTRAIVQNCTERLYPKPSTARSGNGQNSRLGLEAFGATTKQEDSLSSTSVRNLRLKSANPISKGGNFKERYLLRASENQELEEKPLEESMREQSPPPKLNLNLGPSSVTYDNEKVQSTKQPFSKDQLKLQLGKLNQNFSQRNKKNSENDQLRYNSSGNLQSLQHHQALTRGGLGHASAVDFKIRKNNLIQHLAQTQDSNLVTKGLLGLGSSGADEQLSRKHYTQQLLFNAKQLINYQTLDQELLGGDEKPRKRKRKRVKVNKVQPYYPNDFYNLNEKEIKQSKGMSRAKSEKALGKLILAKSSRPISAYKPTWVNPSLLIFQNDDEKQLNQNISNANNSQRVGLSLLTAIGENSYSQRIKTNSNQNSIDQHQNGANVMREDQLNAMGLSGLEKIQESQEFRGDMLLNTEEEEDSLLMNQEDDGIQILDQHRKNLRPMSQYQNAKGGSRQGARKPSDLQDLVSPSANQEDTPLMRGQTMNFQTLNPPHYSSNLAMKQKINLGSAKVEQKSLKRPISAVNLFRKPTNSGGNPYNPMSAQALASMRQLQMAYDLRPPSGVTSMVSMKKDKEGKSKKIKKRVKAVPDPFLDNQEEIIQDNQRIHIQQHDFNSPDSLSFQLSQSANNLNSNFSTQNLKLAADQQRILSSNQHQALIQKSSSSLFANSRAQVSYQSQKTLTLNQSSKGGFNRPDSSQTANTHATSTRFSQMSSQKHMITAKNQNANGLISPSSQNFNFGTRGSHQPQLQGQNDQLKLQVAAQQPNQFFSQILHQKGTNKIENELIKDKLQKDADSNISPLSIQEVENVEEKAKSSHIQTEIGVSPGLITEENTQTVTERVEGTAKELNHTEIKND